jgi:3-deoxy-D-manno-octulosonic-acid transferase
MLFLVDVLYFLCAPLLLVWAAVSRIKGHPPRKGLLGRLGHGVTLNQTTNRVVLHAVSVGEVNAIRTLISDLHDSGYELVICVTTDTGLQRAEELFGKDHTVTRYPLDFGFAVRRFLKRVKPNIFALVELEVWPNCIGISEKRNIPVVVINGRLSERSFKRYKIATPLLRKTFSRLAAIGMQTEMYAQRVRELGGKNVSVLGTMKWDNAKIVETVEGAEELAKDLGINTKKPLIVAGSTTPEEHALLLDSIPEGVQLLCAPRRPEWFDDAEKILAPCNRRTSNTKTHTNHFLLDTFGELDKAYALADIVVIGRSFSPLHGSDPVQSIAFGKPTIIGPNASDFEDMVYQLVEGNGLIQCTKEELKKHIQLLLEDASLRTNLVTNGRKIIQSQQGATKRYEQLIVDNMP